MSSIRWRTERAVNLRSKQKCETQERGFYIDIPKKNVILYR